MTANTDDAHFNRAKETKPFKKLDLQRTIELTISQMDRKIRTQTDLESQNSNSFILNDCIFVRHLNSLVKVDIKDILYIEAERNYCRIFSSSKEYLVVMSLKVMNEKLPSKYFLRTHRSYIINLSQSPRYRATTGISWLDKGGVYVLANIRDGGEYGPKWHQNATKEKRQNAFDDLYAVSEDVIDKKVTSPKHLGAMGGSNSGLLVGVAFMQRPDLYNAIVCRVPLLDMQRYNKLLAGARNYSI